MDLTAPGLENQLVRLEPLSEAHREILRSSNAVEYMWQSMPAIQRGAGYDAYFDFVLRNGKHDDLIAFAVIAPEDGRLIGVTAFIDPNRTHRRVEIGYTWIDEAMRGRGIFRALQSLLITRAVMWGARRIGWRVEARNQRAIRAIEALGARREGILRNYSRFADGTWVDIAVLSLLRDEAKAAVMRIDAGLKAVVASET